MERKREVNCKTVKNRCKLKGELMNNNLYITDKSANLTTMRDPMVLVADGKYYITGTQPPYFDGDNEGVHLWSTKDFEKFEDCGLILKRADMPETLWCRDRFWAPELFDGKDGWFYLTFNCCNEGPEHIKKLKNVGIARSRKVTGPYEILSYDKALTEGLRGGNDGSMFADDDGKLYLLCNEKDAIMLYEYDKENVCLLNGRAICERGKNDEWDSAGVEGPCLVKKHNKYFLWYSSWTNGYNAGLCTADSIDGPWEKSKQNPVIGDNDLWHHAGHNHSFTSLDGKDYLIFHANIKNPEEEDVERIIIRPVEYLKDGTVKLK